MNNNIKQLRVERGLTQAQLAEKLKISRTSMINIENRTYSGIDKKILQRLCEFFNASPVKILGLQNLRDEPQTEEEIDWLIEELNKEKERWAKE